MLNLTHNPRVIAASLAPRAEAEMRALGVADYGLEIMGPKSRHFVIALENVPRREAGIIKRLAHTFGAEAAINQAVMTAGVETTALLLMANLSQLSHLSGKLLHEGSGLPELGRLFVATAVAYERRRWTIRFPGTGPRTLELGPRPVVMGILNVTPDSFSGDGQLTAAAPDPSGIADRALKLAADGAAIIDIGGESTRPGAAEVPAEAEAARVVPVIAALRRQSPVLISVDTRKAAVARAALDAGADLVNDISALADPEMAPLVARAGCPLVLMHMQGSPATMQQEPRYDEVVADVIRFLRQAVARAAAAGIDPDQIIVDPGIGFGKTLDHNVALLGRLAELRSLGRPILVGPSRKRFLGQLLDGAGPGERLMGTAATCVWTRARGAAIFRVHDVAEVARALRVAAALETAEDKP